jgi:thioredoxin reductase (NADPH)
MDYDLIIIGAGPSGLACAIEAKHAGLNYLVIEKGGITDAIRRFPVNMTFFSTCDLIEIGNVPFSNPNMRPNRLEALQYYRRVVEHFDLNLELHTTVLSIKQSDSGFDINCDSGNIKTANVVVATGYFDHTNKLDIPGEDLSHVSHYYDEAFAYAGTKILIIGGRNSSAEAALDLYRHGAKVTMIHRRDALKDSIKYWIKPDLENRIKEGAIDLKLNTIAEDIRLDEVDLKNLETGKTETLEADFVLALIGYRPDERLLREAGVIMDKKLIPEYDVNSFETNVAGLYIAGSVACGNETWNIFIENGREHASPIIKDILKQ